HRELAKGPTPYSEVTGKQGAILKVLSPAYHNSEHHTTLDEDYNKLNRYWSTLTSLDLESCPGRAWSDLLPIEASLTLRVRYAPATNLKVSPRPRVLLYPFGWSTWISVRITGEYTLATLSDLAVRLFSPGAFQVEGEAKLLSLIDLFDRVSHNVRLDAFGGPDTNDTKLSEVITVTTVLAKTGGGPSIDALDDDMRSALWRIVRPDGAPAGGKLEDRAWRLKKPFESPLHYVLMDGYSRFNWLDHLLAPVGRKHDHLRCYHNNSLLSLVHADHMNALVGEAVGSRAPCDALTQLASRAARYLNKRPYMNAGLVGLLDRKEIKDTLDEAKNHKLIG
ncbi:MAG TPA: hypothetical protein VLZ81_18295, partial [Blastocatellia bacterium]|nr:hypothetical protein [Blastocatellia bacterium]